MESSGNNVHSRQTLYVMLRILTTALMLMFVVTSYAQQRWLLQDKANLSEKSTKLETPQAYSVFSLHDIEAYKQELMTAPTRERTDERPPLELSLPLPNGKQAQFTFYDTPIMVPALQDKFPHIRTFTGVGLTQSGALAKIDFTDHGFHGMILSPGEPAVFINPYRLEDGLYMVFYKSDYPNSLEPFVCHTEHDASAVPESGARQAGDCEFRRYRLALACTGEYAQYHGGTTSGAMSAMTVSMNRVNGIYEKNVGLTMQFVANNDDLIYLNGATDPYTNNSGGTMLNENQANVDNVIGTANYDVGHVFSTGGGGVASLRSPCSSTRKARGVTGLSAPVGDPFDVDYVAHEFGHQWGGNHTQNNGCNRVSGASYEPGSASTIMGYAGICAPNVQNNSDAYFHARSIDEMAAFITNNNTGGSCDEIISTGNTAPSVNAGLDYYIPKSTAFTLTAAGSDGDGDPLTYCWEQYNREFSDQPPKPTNTDGPNFRSLTPTSSNARDLPTRGIGNTWEVLSSVTRTLDFRVTVRDFNATYGYGCTDEDDMKVYVQGNSSLFGIELPNGGETWAGGSTQTVYWDVAGTTASPFNASNVTILLSIDDGYTYPYTLLASTANDGSAEVVVPNIGTTNARIRVAAVENIFFDVMDDKFTIDQNSNCPNTLTFDMTPISAGNYYTITSITATVPVANAANVLFQSNEINLNQNFEVPLGAEFEAVNGGCP